MKALAGNNRPFRHEEGSTMIEFALSSAVLFSLLFGILTVCLALYSYNAIAEAAREGARFAIVRGSASCGYNTPCNVGKAPSTDTSVSDFIKSQSLPGINTANIQVTSSWPTTGVNCTPNPAPGCNNPGNLVKVKVVYSFPMSIPFVPAQTLSMSSTAQMVIAH